MNLLDCLKLYALLAYYWLILLAVPFDNDEPVYYDPYER